MLVAKHIMVAKFPIWLSNAVIMSKGQNKWRICMEFKDLNKACPKDHYPLLHIDQLVDVTSGCEFLSMIDAYHKYHQIRMHLDDVAKTTFGVCYGVFGY